MILGMTPALLLLQLATVTPSVTVAITISGISLAGVASLIFKAGEWRGEHRALQKEVTTAHADMTKQMSEGFARIERDIRELRKEASS
jgi:hypothetical protein